MRKLGRGLAARALVIGAAGVLISGCDSLSGCDGPEFTASIIEPVELNQQFTRVIRVRIDGSDNDEAFTYRFDRTGDLPPGVSGSQDSQIQQHYLLTGTPTALGSFPFVLSVRVDDGLDESSCDSFVASNEFTLQVNMQGMGTGEVPPG